MSKKCKLKKCSECPKALPETRNSLQVVCSPSCAYTRVKRLNERKASTIANKQRKAEKKALRARKQALKSKSDWLREAQVAFNKFIRLRDKDEPCISCGRYDNEIGYIGAGGKWDAGHWKTRGAFPELRFTENNAHKQCKSCNGGAGKYTKKNHTVAQQYKINLIEKIGQKNVDLLETKHEPLKLTIDDIKLLKAEYHAKIKEL
jgi:hypothetical protein